MSLAPGPLGLMVRKLERHGALSAGDRGALLALPHMLRTVNPISYLVREGDPPTQCAVLISGYAFRQKLTGDGSRQIVSLHIPGDLLDLQNLYLDIADHSVQTLTFAELAIIPRKAMHDLCGVNAAIARAMLVSILIEAAMLREWLLNIGRRDARARLAHLLCEFATRLDAQGISNRNGYELPMNQEQLGDALGLTPVHINRTLRALEKDGLVKRQGRHIGFPRWEALREIADFSSRYLHLDQQTR